MHYLSYLSIGLLKEDFSLLMKSNLDEQLEEMIKKNENSSSDSDLYSTGS